MNKLFLLFQQMLQISQILQILKQWQELVELNWQMTINFDIANSSSLSQGQVKRYRLSHAIVNTIIVYTRTRSSLGHSPRQATTKRWQIAWKNWLCHVCRALYELWVDFFFFFFYFLFLPWTRFKPFCMLMFGLFSAELECTHKKLQCKAQEALQ